ncbi:MAG: hypothetical protein AB7N70_39190 [Dehalococcoidia bacterium]
MIESTQRPRTHAHRALTAIACTVALAVALLWSWNAIGVAQFAWPQLNFGQALSLATLLMMLRLLFCGAPPHRHAETPH